MKLSQLIEGQKDIEIQSLNVDSRKKCPDSIFFCIKGFSSDGHKYAEQAIENGAKVIVYSEPFEKYHEDVIYIHSDNVVQTENEIAARFNGDPSKKMFMLGVTGTNGKSTITNIFREVMNTKEPTGYVGTIAIEYGDVKYPPSLTSPEAILLQSILKDMVDAGMKDCALECSSIGLDQGRMLSVDFDAAVFTNLTYDHLDYHKTMENYYQAKKILFDSLKEDAFAVTNTDDECGMKIVEDCKCPVYTYGIHHDAMYKAENVILKADSTSFDLVFEGKNYPVFTNLTAEFNVSNVLAAIAVLHHHDMTLEEIITALKDVHSIEGRMHLIKEGQPYHVVIDFSHTPDGIEKVCKYAQVITPKESHIIAITGSAGKRDTAKRPMFGKILSEYCDEILLTEDDPRDEKADEIAKEIAQGIKDTKWCFIEDRESAIQKAVKDAKENDTIIILGKGDERFIYRENGRVPYKGDDVIAKEAVLERMKGL